ncbi:hypothetical protein B0H11DRAFT_519141 [Mycena galericulata]|nr:hypothetical protein B0H11DRAFT_519141 [Mycena galericulata]
MCPLESDAAQPTLRNTAQAGQPTITTIQALACFPVLPIQAICPFDLILFDPTIQTIAPPIQTTAPVHTSSVLPPSPSSYLLSPLVLIPLLCLASVIAAGNWRRTKKWQSSTDKGPVPVPMPVPVSVRQTRIPTMQKPSDSPNWRIPHSDLLETIQTPAPPTDRRPMIPVALVPAQDSSDPTPCDSTPKSTTPLRYPAMPAATPVYATYVPPHKRASGDFGSRRPFAQVVNGVDNRPQTPVQANQKLRRRLSTQLPSLAKLPEPLSGKLHHRASFPADPSKDTPARRYRAAPATDKS